MVFVGCVVVEYSPDLHRVGDILDANLGPELVLQDLLHQILLAFVTDVQKKSLYAVAKTAVHESIVLDPASAIPGGACKGDREGAFSFIYIYIHSNKRNKTKYSAVERPHSLPH